MASLSLGAAGPQGVTPTKAVDTSPSIIFMTGQAVGRVLEELWTPPNPFTLGKSPEHERISQARMWAWEDSNSEYKTELSKQRNEIPCR